LRIEEEITVRGDERSPSIVPNSPAAIGGLMAEDIIVSAQLGDHDPIRITRGFTLPDYLIMARPGDSLVLRVLRGENNPTEHEVTIIIRADSFREV
jgi:S1-C subfamily serine protease